MRKTDLVVIHLHPVLCLPIFGFVWSGNLVVPSLVSESDSVPFLIENESLLALSSSRTQGTARSGWLSSPKDDVARATNNTIPIPGNV